MNESISKALNFDTKYNKNKSKTVINKHCLTRHVAMKIDTFTTITRLESLCSLLKCN